MPAFDWHSVLHRSRHSACNRGSQHTINPTHRWEGSSLCRPDGSRACRSWPPAHRPVSCPKDAKDIVTRRVNCCGGQHGSSAVVCAVDAFKRHRIGGAPPSVDRLAHSSHSRGFVGGCTPQALPPGAICIFPVWGIHCHAFEEGLQCCVELRHMHMHLHRSSRAGMPGVQCRRRAASLAQAQPHNSKIAHPLLTVHLMHSAAFGGVDSKRLGPFGLRCPHKAPCLIPAGSTKRMRA